jgi:hypothetical protein
VPKVSRSGFLASFVGAMGITHATLAQPPNDSSFEIRAVAGHSDNITRVETNTTRASYEALGLLFDLAADRRRFDGALRGDIELRRYSAPVLDDGDDTESVGSVDARSIFGIVPERLSWDVGLHTGQLRTDPLAALTPENRERVTVVSTGPRIDVPLGGRTILRFAATAADRAFAESSSFDNDARSVDLHVVRAVTSISTVALEWSGSEVDFDSRVDYEFDATSIVYRKSLASGAVMARLGVGSVDSVLFDSGSTTLYGLRWDRALGSRTELSTWVARDLTDPSVQFVNGNVPGLVDVLRDTSVGGGSVEIDDVRLSELVLADSPAERTAVGLSVMVAWDRGRARLALGETDEKFFGGAIVSNDTRFFEIFVSRSLSQRWDLEGWLRATTQDFADLRAESDERFMGFSLARRLAERARLGIGFQRNSRTVDVDPSDENNYFVDFRYDLARR